MNTIFNTAFRLTLASTVLLSSCYKIDVGDIFRDRDKVNSVCKIKRLKYTYPGYDSPIVTEFRYNKWGDPDSIISSLSTTGHPGLHLFYYDSHHRLTEYMSLYRSSEAFDHYQAYHGWSRYYYDYKGRIAWDSTYVMGNYVDGHPVPPYNTGYMSKNEHFYDQHNRVIKGISHVGGTWDFTYDYKYTPQGNLDNGPYDNKVNIYQTNKIWQFLAKDYSVNNPLFRNSPLSYNKYGLPTSYSGSYIWLNLPGDNLKVEYDCK